MLKFANVLPPESRVLPPPELDVVAELLLPPPPQPAATSVRRNSECGSREEQLPAVPARQVGTSRSGRRAYKDSPTWATKHSPNSVVRKAS